MTITLYHHPGCTTSRGALEMIRAAGIEPEIVLYQKLGWTAPQLSALFKAAKISARDALRVKEAKAVRPDLLASSVPEADLIAAMVAHPLLVERPFVTTPKGSALCRPLEVLTGLL